MRMSPAGRAFLARWEGVRLHPYRCAANVLTIGVGHALTDLERNTGVVVLDGLATSWRPGLSRDQVDLLLSQDLREREDAINALDLTLVQHQFDALVSFVFNIGAAAFLKSTLSARLHRGDFASVPGQLKLWTRAGGVVNKGLQKRRAAESRLFMNGDYTGAP